MTERALVPASRQLAIRHAQAGSADYVPHVTAEQVRAMADTMGKRDRLLILTLFDACLRCSEAIALTPADITDDAAGFALRISKGKGGKYGVVAVSPSLAVRLKGYAYDEGIKPNERLFPVTRSRAFQIVAQAFERAGIRRPSKAVDHVGTVHCLRHSGAIERLRQTGNPKAVQDQLRHKSALMTLRYLRTLSQEESLQIQEAVEFGW